MAAPVIGNSLQSNPTPGSNNITTVFNNIFMMPPSQPGNEMVIVMATMSNANGRSFTGATYGGQTMTELYQQNRAGLSQRMVFYYLEQAPTGSNTLALTFNGNQFNPVSLHVRSFGDCGGVGASLRTGGQPTPHNGTIIVEEDSLIVMTSCSVNQILTQEIPTGNNRTFTTHNTNRQVATRAISDSGGFSAGTISLRATSTFGTVTLDRTEIKALSTTPLNEGSMFKLFI